MTQRPNGPSRQPAPTAPRQSAPTAPRQPTPTAPRQPTPTAPRQPTPTAPQNRPPGDAPAANTRKIPLHEGDTNTTGPRGRGE
jgi:hypothetical protein